MQLMQLVAGGARATLATWLHGEEGFARSHRALASAIRELTPAAAPEPGGAPAGTGGAEAGGEPGPG